MISITEITPPTFPVVTLAEAKAHLRVGISEDDALITHYVEAARDHLELTWSWRAYTERELSASFDWWDGSTLWLPMPPTIELLELAIVDDATGGSVALDLGLTALDKDIGRVRLYGAAVGGGGAPGRMVARYTTGYPETGIPAWCKQAVLLTLGHYYENRESITVGAGVTAIEIPQTAMDIAYAHRAWRPRGAI